MRKKLKREHLVTSAHAGREESSACLEIAVTISVTALSHGPYVVTDRETERVAQEIDAAVAAAIQSIRPPNAELA